MSGDLVDGLWPAVFGTWLDAYGNQGYTYIFITLIAVCVVGILNALFAMDHNKKCLAGKRKMVIKEIDEK